MVHLHTKCNAKKSIPLIILRFILIIVHVHVNSVSKIVGNNAIKLGNVLCYCEELGYTENKISKNRVTSNTYNPIEKFCYQNP
jgi:hypothetical protein